MATYENPVWPRSFPDPFVLAHRGEYWAYCTGSWPDGRRFGVLHSTDLVTWQPLAGALAPLRPQAEDWPCYWAPEVAYWEGRFYLYYSVGDEARMEIRVAVAERPEGPFADAGKRLTAEPFAIDAHPFTAPDGSRWLFYATDFLTHSHIGTGTVADRLLDPETLAGAPRPITRALYDWQVYHPNRPEKGGVRWHTVEGPFVLFRKGLYYQMYSGGNWQNPTYGVSYAVSATLEAPGEWAQAADGERVLPVLRTLPGQVIGPGHNSVVRGPDRRQLWCVYHRWDTERGERVMAIDPLDWAGDRLLVLGPSTGPRPAPEPPTFADRFSEEHQEGLGEEWRVHGRFQMRGGEALADGLEETAVARRAPGATSFLAVVSARLLEAQGACGIGLFRGGGETPDLQLLLTAEGRAVVVRKAPGAAEGEERLDLLDFRGGLSPGAFHRLSMEVDGPRVRLTLDDLPLWTGTIAGSLEASLEGIEIGLVAAGGWAAFSGFSLTLGWEDLFYPETGDPAGFGWEVASGSWRLSGRELVGEAEGEGEAATAAIFKGPLFADYELVVNLRLLPGSAGGWGLHPARTATGPGPLLALVPAGPGWALAVRDPYKERPERLLPFPAGFDPAVFQQLRLKKAGGCLAIAWEGHSLGEIEVSPEPARPGLHLARAAVAVDAVRVTARG
jgi:GH43 family beta-xylosidase